MTEPKQAELAPIILFTYNRPEHTRITLEYLSRCDLASQSTLYVFCDGPKADASAESRQKIEAVKTVLAAVKWPKEVVLEFSAANKGLYRNVTQGVDLVVKKHGKCIVVEDDLKIGRSFLTFMNTALSTYEHDKRVKQVSGFIFPAPIEARHRAIFMPMTNTWGWGTWERAWREVDWSAPGYEALLVDKYLSRRFNLNNTYDYSKMLARQMANEQYGSWGILYWWSVFKANGIVLYPDYSLIQYNDFDHSGVHASDGSHCNYPAWNETYRVDSFPGAAEGVDQKVFDAVCAHLRKRSSLSIKNISIKIGSILKKYLR